MKIVMLPWLAYGHISPFLELAKRLSDRNFQIYLCSTPMNLSSVKNKIPEKYSVSIQLVELHLPCLPELPPNNFTTNGLPLHLYPTLRKAFDMSKPKFSEILKTLQPDLLIHDVMIQWASNVAFTHNIPALSFMTSGAIMSSYVCHCLMKPKGTEYPYSSAIRFSEFEQDKVNGFVEFAKGYTPDKASQAILIKSSREIEDKYIDYFSELNKMKGKVFPVGPLFLSDPGKEEESLELMEWLAKKDKLSTVYVSFGSECFLKKEEIEEIAFGLELSDVNFIWVMRFPVGENIRAEESLPEGFLERVGERGKIVEKWAPQTKILGHSSVAGFVSHCGWNSLLESVDFGVPIIAMPMHADQPFNAKLVVELGVGVEVVRDEKGRFRRGEIGKLIKDIVFGETGERLRKNVLETRERLTARSEKEMDVFVQEIAKLCDN